jgi:CheY-like chemotaxis protein/anti-sigma regulatory factor (Ser/Thr protein kinase)
MEKQEPSRARILVVEDEPALRTLIERLLREEGHAVETLADGDEALERLRRESYDLVLIDVWLPGRTGLEVLAELRREGREVRAVVMTGDVQPETVVGSVREQALRYVAKPFTSAELLEQVGRALGSRPGVPPVEVVSATPRWIELVVPCDREIADRLHDIMMHLESDLPEETRDAVGHAFRELLLNAVEWGGGFDPGQRVRICYLRGRRFILYRIADPGRGFRFEGLEHAAVTNFDRDPLEHARERERLGMRPGGLGILLARAVVDELFYNETQNEVVFVKYLDAPPAAPAPAP